jgi:hypothetical protein
MLELIDETFNQVPFTIQMLVVVALRQPILLRRNHGENAFSCD